MKLAISGKGGVGTTTIAAALVHLFAQTHQTVYAIDGDPDACLATVVGIPAEKAEQIKPVVEMRDKIRSVSGEGALYVLNPKLDDSIVDDYCYTLGNIKLMRMGNVKKGGSECYCRENTFLGALLSNLLLDKNEVVIMDMGAGIEHLSRGTAKGVDIMLVVVEPSINSVNTARNVKKMAGDLGIQNIKIIGNKIRTEKEKQFIANAFKSQEIIGFLKFNNSIWESGMDDKVNVLEKDLLYDLKEIQKRILTDTGGI